jgi:arylsulfatase A-like enzyme
MQEGLHGALRREHIVVPLLIWSKRLDWARAERYFAGAALPRTADVYPTALALLGLQPPKSISWEERDAKKVWLGRKTVTRNVRTDIDGRVLDIFR